MVLTGLSIAFISHLWCGFMCNKIKYNIISACCNSIYFIVVYITAHETKALICSLHNNIIVGVRPFSGTDKLYSRADNYK